MARATALPTQWGLKVSEAKTALPSEASGLKFRLRLFNIISNYICFKKEFFCRAVATPFPRRGCKKFEKKYNFDYV